MAYKYMTAGASIRKTPRQQHIDDFQQLLDEQFYDAADVFTIQEETALASGVYQNIDVRITGLINTNTGERIEDDFKKILFQDVGHPVSLGKMYQFDSNYWVTVNIDKVKTLASTATVRRCNNVLRWQDRNTGAVYRVPCAVNYLIKENRNYSTSGSELVVPSGMIEVFAQFNNDTNRIRPNQRFLLGNSSNWISYRVQGGGLANFNNLTTLDNMSVGLLRLSFEIDYTNNATDDIVNGIADYIQNTFVLTLTETTVSGGAGQTVQLHPTLTRNGETVSGTYVWSSNDTAIATVNSAGLVTFVAEGSCTIRCSLSGDALVYDTCGAATEAAPVDTYQVVFTPNQNYVLEGKETTWSVFLWKNGVQQPDTFAFTLDANTVPSSHYTYTVVGGNSFKIKNYEMFLTDTLDVQAVSGAYSMTTSITLRGAW